MVDTVEFFSASPLLQNGLDAEAHDVQVWGGRGPLMLGPKLRKNSLTKALSEARSVRRSPVLLEGDRGVPILRLIPWSDRFTQEMEIDGCGSFFTSLDESMKPNLTQKGSEVRSK